MKKRQPPRIVLNMRNDLIWMLWKDVGITQAMIAEVFRLSRHTVSGVVRREQRARRA